MKGLGRPVPFALSLFAKNLPRDMVTHKPITVFLYLINMAF